jgi:hypothetical protein
LEVLSVVYAHSALAWRGLKRGVAFSLSGVFPWFHSGRVMRMYTKRVYFNVLLRFRIKKVKNVMKFVRMMGLVLLTFLVPCLQKAAAGGFGAQEQQAEGTPRLGIFSWQKRNASNEALRDDMLDNLVRLGISEVYQYMDEEDASSLIKRAGELGIDVYLLDGQPEWGLDREAGQMRRAVRRAARLMEEAGGPGLAGLVLDVEPYLTSSYDRNPERAMDRFSEAMRNTYAYAREKGVPLIICIPYFYDTKGFEKELKGLIQEGSDAVAVMNYQKKDEAGQIEAEMEDTMRAGKQLIHIFELQRPGLFDLTERNTYFLDGLPAVWASRDQLYRHYGYEGLSFALHDYEALSEMMNDE